MTNFSHRTAPAHPATEKRVTFHSVERRFVAKVNGSRVTVSGSLTETCDRWALEIRSDRNRAISRMSDVARDDPEPPENAPEAENWFPVVDICVDAQVSAELRLSGSRATKGVFNSYLDKTPVDIGEKPSAIPGSRLLDWENTLYVPSCDADAHLDFALIRTMPHVPSVSLKAWAQLELLTPDWGGDIIIHRIDANGARHPDDRIVLERTSLASPPHRPDQSKPTALDLTLSYILGSINRTPHSPFKDGLYLHYDLAADTYRNGTWPWCWGPAIKLLLDAAALTDGSHSFSADELVNAAYGIGDCSLRMSIENPNAIYDGFSTTRYTPRTTNPPGTIDGFQELVNTGSDGGFLAGWGWIPLYEATGDKRFLDACETYIAKMRPVLDAFPMPPQEWLPGIRNWTAFTIDESGFGTEGIAALYQVTGRDDLVDLCRVYVDQHIALFERPDGFWQRQYNFPDGRVDNTEFMTRGMAWAMEGLVAAYRCTRDAKYLQKAVKMADAMLAFQRDDGAWSFRFTGPKPAGGDADKGTAVWCVLLYQLYAETSDPRHLASARRAMKWLENNQYKGPNIHALGGVVSASGEAGITYRMYFPMCCHYTSSFFGLALLEDRKLL